MNVGIDTDFLVRLAILEHPGRESAMERRDILLSQGDRFALATQVISEFIHVVTDPRRFEKPFSMSQAVAWIRTWGTAQEVDTIAPSADAFRCFFKWMLQHDLGRKRILDTMLAATYVTAGVTHLLTGNPADYRVFNGLVLLKM